jgi:LPXTG-motif cell wall-anchored protein
VPSVCRRITVLLAVACLGASAPVTSALAQGAGDQQYQDPFGSSSSGSTKPKTTKPKTSTQTSPSPSLKPLSPSPQTSGSQASGASGASSSGTAGTSGAGAGTTTTPAATAARSSLPSTGLDTRVLLLGGAALLLFGLGLRLRSRPERF